ncbi:RSM24 [Sanghuangporus sanghuang]|uniref:Small ribosomal subunit protein mS35 mitochondrial conserved domain-containing protein n=1 Tax=Sanghuangporus baumii TaxID=108892 RepID=A0A9Q5NF53_SANBA|nr:hypothetical protein A7U60_g829 [Sanghuangporus baumii]
MQALANIARSRLSTRAFHASVSAPYPRPRRVVGRPPPPILAQTGVFLDEDEDIEEDIPYEEKHDYGSSSLGHLLLRQQRHMLNYMRLIEHDMPNLVQFRERFAPPQSDRPLVVRSIDYGGEEHPATAKRSVVVAVSRLPLKDEKARHVFKLLAGPRWSPSAPPDAGIGPNEGHESDGYVKISCEDFPQPGMNLKWISDALDKLIEKANAKSRKYAQIPLDTRHLEARRVKAGGNRGIRPSLRDFPSDWLPLPAAS